MRTYFHRLHKGELDFIIENCNFSKDDRILINMASQKCSDVEIATKLHVCVSTVTKRKQKIRKKIMDFLKGYDDMTTVYVNGERVTKEELKNMEIKDEGVKKILADKLTKKE